jgi:hypothetical protein
MFDTLTILSGASCAAIRLLLPEGIIMLIKDLIEEYYKNINQILDLNRHRAFFMTVSFTSPNYLFEQHSNIIGSQIRSSFQKYNGFYRHLSSKLKNHFTKHLNILPRTFDFIDFPGTRHSKTISLNAEPKTPHIHSVYLVHNDTIERFESLMKTKFSEIVSHPSQRSVISAYAVPIKPTNADLKRVLSYSMKFLCDDPRAESLNEDTPLMNQFPICKDELKTRSNPDERFFVSNADLLTENCLMTMNREIRTMITRSEVSVS